MSTLTFSNLRIGQKLKIRNGWNAGRTARVTNVTTNRVTANLDNGMPVHWRLDIAGWMPQVEVIK